MNRLKRQFDNFTHLPFTKRFFANSHERTCILQEENYNITCPILNERFGANFATAFYFPIGNILTQVEFDWCCYRFYKWRPSGTMPVDGIDIALILGECNSIPARDVVPEHLFANTIVKNGVTYVRVVPKPFPYYTKHDDPLNVRFSFNGAYPEFTYYTETWNLSPELEMLATGWGREKWYEVITSNLQEVVELESEVSQLQLL